MSQNNKKLVIALLQLPCSSDATANVNNAVAAIKEAKIKNPKLQLAVLPETFSSPYRVEEFAKYAQKVPEGPACQALSKLAQTLGIYIVGGSVVERGENDKIYNTCTVWSPEGKLIGKHRKMHLFSVDIDRENNGGCQFNEALVFSPGNEITIVEIDNHKVGIGICHDKHFGELARIYRNHGCEMLVYPSNFCICQGPMFLELLHRTRAMDNQLFFVTCSPARSNMSGYISYGHSMIADPWGRLQCKAGVNRETVIEEIDFSLVDDVRRQIPLFPQRRTDVYKTSLVKE